MYLGVDEIILVRLSQVLVLAPIPRSASVLAGDATHHAVILGANLQRFDYVYSLFPILASTDPTSDILSIRWWLSQPEDFRQLRVLSFTSAGDLYMPIIHHVLRHPTRTRSRHSPSRPPLQRPMSRVLTLPEIMILWLVHRFGVISLVKGFPIALPCKLLLWQFIFPLISQPARCTYLGLIFKSYLRPFSSMLFWIKLLSTVIRWRCRIYDHHY